MLQLIVLRQDTHDLGSMLREIHAMMKAGSSSQRPAFIPPSVDIDFSPYSLIVCQAIGILCSRNTYDQESPVYLVLPISGGSMQRLCAQHTNVSILCMCGASQQLLTWYMILPADLGCQTAQVTCPSLSTVRLSASCVTR